MSDPATELDVLVDGAVATLTMNRPAKRNAMNDRLLGAIESFYAAPPAEVRVVILTGAGGHFCSGLDLSEHVSRDAEGTLHHSRSWHRVVELIRLGGLVTVSAMQGAVVGGGLEIAAATHVRIAEPSAMFQLPEGMRGIFVGGGGSVNIGRIIGADRMTEMMLTGRKYGAEDGLRLGLCHYAVGDGESLTLARELAAKIAGNAPLTNFVIVQALARIQEMPRQDALFTESLSAALTQTSPDAQEGLRAFLEKRAPSFGEKT